jgi:putative flippase GtrA
VKFVNTSSHSFRYLLIGFYNTIVGYLLFGLVNYVLGSFTHYLVIFGVSFILSLTHAYVGQRYIVFRSTAPWWREYLRFFIVNLTGMAGNALLLVVFVESGMGLMVAQAISVLIVTVFSYFGHRYFSFRSS